MDLEFIRADIQQRRRQISRQRREILQRTGISTRSAEELLARMLAKVDEPCVERETHASFKEKAAQSLFSLPAEDHPLSRGARRHGTEFHRKAVQVVDLRDGPEFLRRGRAKAEELKICRNLLE